MGDAECFFADGRGDLSARSLGLDGLTRPLGNARSGFAGAQDALKVSEGPGGVFSQDLPLWCDRWPGPRKGPTWNGE